MSQSIQFFSGEKILYQDHDDRININEMNDLPNDLKAAVVEQTKSIACLILVDNFTIDPATRVHQLRPITHNDNIQAEFGYPLATDQKFRDELAPGFGTAFAVDKGVFTAAHCVCLEESNILDENLIARLRLIFNFRIGGNGRLKTSYSENEVYKIRKVSVHKWERGNRTYDYAWLKLDKPMHGIPALQLDFSPVEKDREVYGIGHGDGLSAKLVTSATIKRLKYTYFYANLSMFKGNSGSPVFDRISKKVIGILFEGIHPEYKIHYDWGGPGQHRVRALKAPAELLTRQKYEKCQFIGEVKVHIEQRIAWLAKKGMEECITNSNQASDKFVSEIKQKIEENEKNRCIATAVAFIPTPWTIIGGISFRGDFVKKIEKLQNRLSMMESIQRNQRYSINLLNAYNISQMDAENLSEIDVVRVARYSSAFSILDYNYCHETVARRMVEIENNFGDKFSPKLLLKLANYELNMGFRLSIRSRELILTYLNNDFENPQKSVAEARIKACYKITKHEEAYQNWDKNILKRISKYMVEQSPRLNFEEARVELGY